MRSPCSAVGCGSKTNFSTGRCSKHRRGAGKLYEVDDRTRLETAATVKTFTDRDGVLHELHRIHSVLHRVGAPAMIRVHPDGVREERWYFRGLPHRVDGPAYESFSADGISHGGLYTLGGIGKLDDSDFVTTLAGYPRDRLREEFSYSSYCELLDEGITAGSILCAIAEDVRTVEGIRAVTEGAPVTWAKAYEDAVR